jgi:hypothetical protein
MLATTYGDTGSQTLRKHYSAIARYVDYLELKRAPAGSAKEGLLAYGDERPYGATTLRSLT